MSKKVMCVLGMLLATSFSTTFAVESVKQIDIKEAISKAEAAGYSNFKEVEYKRGRWKLEGVDKRGSKVEIKMDETGKILKVEKEYL